MRRAWRTKSAGEHLARAAAAGGLPRVLGLAELTFLGLGSIVGAGVFVLSGVTANSVAGPGVVLSYLVAAAAAALAGLCYAEYAADLPVAGGAYNFVSVTFGELAAWSVGWNMILEVTLSSAAVARGFSAYAGALAGAAPGAGLVAAGPLSLDFGALALVAALTAMLARGTKESMALNMAVSIITLCSIALVLAAGFPLADPANLRPFLPYGMRGVFSAAGIVFFAFIGFDYIANASEEARNPGRDLPLSILASLGVATLLYVAMSAAIVLAVPYPEIDAAAPFAAAFQARGMAWAARAVSVGALAGIVTSTMSGLLSQSRLLLVLGRERLLPAWLARVAAGSGAPVNATLVTGAAAGLMALTVEIQLLAEMVSAGTLYVFWAVTCGVVFRRCHRAGEPGGARVLRRLGALTAASAALSLSYTYGAPWAAVAGAGAGWAGAAAAVAAMPTVWAPEKFAVPLFPATPVLGVLFTIHLLCSLGWPAYVRFAVWMAAGAAVYGLYGARSAQAEEDLAEARFRAQLDGSEDGENGGGGGEVELLQRAPLRALGPERPVPSGAGDGDGAALLPRDGAASSRV